MTKEERMERVISLGSRLLDGLLTAPERVELNELLRGDPETCERYLELAEVHSVLVRENDEIRSGEIADIFPFPLFDGPDSAKRTRFRRPWRPFLAAAAAVVLLANSYLLWKRPAPIPTEPSHVPGVAVLSRLVDANWGEGGKPPAEGEPVPTGPFRLEAGLAQLEFFSGATLILEG